MDVKELKIYQKLASKQFIRMVAFGSSSTQRFDVGMHWFDFVELGFKNVYGGSCGQFINSGVTNNTTKDLLERFDSQLAVYCPDLVIVTVGANDCIFRIPLEESHQNLLRLHAQITELGADVVFQTFYACDMQLLKELNLEWNRHLVTDMVYYLDTIRGVAKDAGCCLIDCDARWSPLRDMYLSEYRKLMRDPLHVNALGNMLIGLDVMRFFDTQLRFDQTEYCHDGLLMQYRLDILSRKVMDFEGRVLR
ncbi:MAG: SGNH/GDSL hydrolase family protein [Candidatus Omnitrophota bacterium]